MKQIIILALILLFAHPYILTAQELKDDNNDSESLSISCAKCSAYFKLFSQSRIASNDNETAKVYEESEKMFFVFSVLLAGSGQDRDKEESFKVTESRVKKEYKTTKQEINNNYDNFLILTEKYFFWCEEILKK